MKILQKNIVLLLLFVVSAFARTSAQDNTVAGNSISDFINEVDITQVRPTIEWDAKKLANQSVLDSLYNSLKEYKEQRKNRGVALTLYKIGLFYGANDKISLNYNENSKNKGAIPYLIKSIIILEELKNGNLLSNGVGLEQGAEVIAQSNDDNAFSLSNEELQKGIAYLKAGLIKYKEHGNLRDIALVQDALSKAYHFAGNDDLALEASKQCSFYKDSIYAKQNAENKALIQETTEQLRLKELAIEVNEKEKQLQLTALKYEYDKKQAAAKSEKEKQQLQYEEQLKREKINFDFEKKRVALIAKNEREKREAAAKAIQDKKDAAAILKLQRQRILTYSGFAAVLLLLGFAGYVIRNNRLLSIEKHKSESLLLNILPSEVADELKERGATTAKYFDSVTVLFTDFVAFTKAGERMGSQRLVEELHTCFKAFDEITSRYHIEKIKTIGDAYLAVCGLPLSDAQHAEHVVKAAIEILAFMNNRRKELGDQTFEIRIGINSGSLVAGIVGVKKFAYDIWGDTVNTAARMEQNSMPGKINISEATYELVKDKFECSYRGEIEAKNKGMLKMYFVEA